MTLYMCTYISYAILVGMGCTDKTRGSYTLRLKMVRLRLALFDKYLTPPNLQIYPCILKNNQDFLTLRTRGMVLLSKSMFALSNF